MIERKPNNALRRSWGIAIFLVLILLIAGMVTYASGAGSDGLDVYADGLQTGWSDWSWQTTTDLQHTEHVQSGSQAIAVTYDSGWAGFHLHTSSAVSLAEYERVQFWIHGGQKGRRKVRVALADGSGTILTKAVAISAQAKRWTLIEIPLADLGAPAEISGIVWQEITGSAQPTFYLDEIRLAGSGSSPTATVEPSPTATIEPSPTATVEPSPTATVEPLPTATSEPSPTATSEPGPTAVQIYGDALNAGWSNWSWSTTVAFNSTSQVHSGSQAVALSYNGGWAGFYLHAEPVVASTTYDGLRFWIHGGASGTREVQVVLADSAGTLLNQAVAVTAPAGQWTAVEIPLANLGAPAEISGIVWQDITGAAQPTFYLDEIELVGGEGNTTPPPDSASGPRLQVDATSSGRMIPEEIYGVNFADEALARDLNIPLNRWGGNATTRYNWQLDVSNRASDWYFENIPNDVTDPAALPDGSHADEFVLQNQRTGTESLLTMPLIGWTPKDREIRCAFSVALYGAQQATDPWRADCGNGVRSDGSAIMGNDPTDTSMAIGPAFVKDWIEHLLGNFGNAAGNGVRYYALDNEPMLWHTTHRDVHPAPVSYDEIRDRSFSYGATIKEVDPTAETLGPALWGWSAYFYSAVDVESGNWSNPPDRNAHGGTPFVPWYLQQMQQYEQTHGSRILDYLDLHYYPQAANVALAPAGSTETQALRLRSTRALWDPAYVDESWINEPVQLLPRMRQWVDENYPGTKLALSEYNWGGLEDMNGALAQADVLGIFGREGLDLATLWDPPAPAEPGAFAFRLYRNYDGQNSTFGDVSVAASSEDPGRLSIYAAQRTDDGALTVVVVNKSDQPLTSNLALQGTADGAAVERYQYSESNLSSIDRLADQVSGGGGLALTFPAQSMTLLVVR